MKFCCYTVLAYFKFICLMCECNKVCFFLLLQTSAFGEGTYLSTELSVCLNWSPSGAIWPQSLLPHTVSCVAVCEVVLHPTVL